MASKPVLQGRSGVFAALALVGLALSPMAARADSIFDLFAPVVSPYAVQEGLSRSGFVVRSAVVRRGDVYVCDVSDRYGVSQRLVIDTRSGRIVEHYSLRPSSRQEAQRPDPNDRFGWAYAPRPEAEVPDDGPGVIEAFPGENPPQPPRVLHQRQLAYGDGHTTIPTVPAVATPPETKPPEKPKPKIARPKPAPSPAAAERPQSATATEAAPRPANSTTPPQPAPAPQRAAAATEPSGLVVSSGTSDAAAAKTPPQPAPVAKGKAINDIPVTPLD